MSSYQIVRLPNFQVTKLSSYQIFRLQIVGYKIVQLPNCYVTKFLVTKILVTKLLVTNNPPILQSPFSIHILTCETFSVETIKETKKISIFSRLKTTIYLFHSYYDYINTMKTTFDFSFDLYQAFEQH